MSALRGPRESERLGRAVWSYGGGVQTAAVAVLIATGRLPRPDAVVMADTGREASGTWDYLREVMAPYLDAHGLRVQVASHELATVDLYGKNGDLLLPAFTDGGGRMPGFCSVEWKRRVVRRWLRAQGFDEVTLWLGISTDEAHRAKDSDVAWLRHHYPLLYEVPLNRAECISLVAQAGLPKPPRSSCWMCPYRGNTEWRELRDEAPADWEKAVALDTEVRARHPGVFLHRSAEPLAQADLAQAGQQLALDLCDSGVCWT